MIEEIDVLSVLGGGDGNNWGRFSGIAEEVVIAVALGKSVYILGGVGGAAHAVGSLMGLGPSLSSLGACLTETAWLGHVSLETTNVYAEVDLEMKAKALALCNIGGPARPRRWRDNTGLMAFLRSL
jgi:hypothetical protein